MTQENKELLLKDLSARLSYGVRVQSTFYNCDGTIWKYENEILTTSLLKYPITRYKPYLFPLSSMSDEIMDEIYSNTGVYDIDVDSSFLIEAGTSFEDLTKISDILHKHHIDYRNLIKKGLAIDATGLNIY